MMNMNSTHIVKRISCLLVIILFFLGVAFPWQVSAQQEICSTDDLKNLQVAIISCGGSTQCTTSPTSPTTTPSQTETATVPVAAGANPYHTVEYPAALNGFSDTAIAGAINKYISDKKPESPFVKLGGDFVKGGKANNVNPLLAVGHLYVENGFGTAPSGWHTIPGSNNAFGRTATQSQPHVTSSGGRLVYKWSSWADSLSGSDSWFVYLRRKLDNGSYPKDLEPYIYKYAPPEDGNNTVAYINNVKSVIDAIAGLAGDPNIDSYASSASSVNCTCDVPTSTTLTGGDNVEKAFRYFVGKQLSVEQAAAIVGNMMQESGVDPENIRDPAGRTQDPNVAGSEAWGIIQWLPATKIVGIAQQAGVTTPIHHLDTQLNIVWWHMNNTSPTSAKNMIAEFKTAEKLEDMVRIFEEKIEGSGGQNMTERIGYANDILANYSSSTSADNPSGVDSAECSGGDGSPSQFIDGFTVYSQTDKRWANAPYGTSTVGVSGCGPAAMSMIITNLLGTPVTPDQTAAYAAEQGMYVSGVGSSWSIGPVLAEKWGLKADPVARDVGAISAALREGKLVIAPGQGSKPFTSGGHFIVIRGITAEGKFRVGDSGHSDTSDKDWDPQQIVNNMRSGGSYAIYK